MVNSSSQDPRFTGSNSAKIGGFFPDSKSSQYRSSRRKIKLLISSPRFSGSLENLGSKFTRPFHILVIQFLPRCNLNRTTYHLSLDPWYGIYIITLNQAKKPSLQGPNIRHWVHESHRTTVILSYKAKTQIIFLIFQKLI